MTPRPTPGRGGTPIPRLVRVAVGAGGVGGLVLAHLEVLSRGPEYAGPLLVLDHLFDAALAGVLLAVAVASGRFALRRVGLEPGDPLDGLLHSAVVGSGVLALLVLVAGLLGALAPAVLFSLVLGVAAVARREVAELPVLCSRALARIRRDAGDRWLLGLAGVVTGCAAAFLLVHGSLPPGDWDSLMYHLEVPEAWLEAGRIHLPEDNLHAAITGLPQLLYLPLLAAGSPASPALLNGLFALLLAAAVFAVGARLLDGESGALATALLWASTGMLIVAVTPRVDTTLTLFLLVGHGAVAAALLEPGARRDHLYRAALVLGLAVGVKYHALAYAAALAPLALWALLRHGDPPPRRGRIALVGILLFGVAALPWLAKNVILMGAPLYPFFARRMIPPWLAGLYGSTAVPGGVDPRVFDLLAQARQTFDPVDLFLAPERLTVEQEAVHYHTNPLLLLLPLWVFRARSRALAALAGPALIYALIVVVPFPAINLRYLFPALAPLTVATAFLAMDLLRAPLKPTVRRGVLVLAATAALVPTARSAVTWTRQAPVLEHAAGFVSEEAYLSAAFPFYASLVAAVNGAVSRDGKVLLLWEARGFYMNPGVIQDNVLRNWPLLEPWTEHGERCLGATGITHVLASTGAVGYYLARGADREVIGLDAFRGFAERCLALVDQGPGYALFRVPSRGGGEGR